MQNFVYLFIYLFIYFQYLQYLLVLRDPGVGTGSVNGDGGRSFSL